MYRMQAEPASFPPPDPGSAEEAGEKRYEGGADQGNTAAGHELLDSLALTSGVVVSVTFHKVNNAPGSETAADGYYECL